MPNNACQTPPRHLPIRQPMSTAKALVKEWHGRKRATAATTPVDDRAALIRTAFAMEMGHSWPAADRAEAG